MSAAGARSRARRRARRVARDAAFERDAERALALNPRLFGHRLHASVMRALFAGDATRRPALWLAGLVALAAIAWVVGRALGRW